MIVSKSNYYPSLMTEKNNVKSMLLNCYP